MPPTRRRASWLHSSQPPANSTSKLFLSTVSTTMTSGGLAEGRLSVERKQWRKDHPMGFYARPAQKGDGSANLFEWECGIPGKDGTDWAGGLYVCRIRFSPNYPIASPDVIFTPPIFHPNVYDDGAVCLSIIGHNWKPNISVKDILVGVQELLNEPNPSSPANGAAARMWVGKKAEYKKLILQQAKRFQSFDDA